MRRPESRGAPVIPTTIDLVGQQDQRNQFLAQQQQKQKAADAAADKEARVKKAARIAKLKDNQIDVLQKDQMGFSDAYDYAVHEYLVEGMDGYDIDEQRLDDVERYRFWSENMERIDEDQKAKADITLKNISSEPADYNPTVSAEKIDAFINATYEGADDEMKKEIDKMIPSSVKRVFENDPAKLEVYKNMLARQMMYGEEPLDVWDFDAEKMSNEWLKTVNYYKGSPQYGKPDEYGNVPRTTYEVQRPEDIKAIAAEKYKLHGHKMKDTYPTMESYQNEMVRRAGVKKDIYFVDDDDKTGLTFNSGGASNKTYQFTPGVQKTTVVKDIKGEDPATAGDINIYGVRIAKKDGTENKPIMVGSGTRVYDAATGQWTVVAGSEIEMVPTDVEYRRIKNHITKEWDEGYYIVGTVDEEEEYMSGGETKTKVNKDITKVIPYEGGSRDLAGQYGLTKEALDTMKKNYYKANPKKEEEEDFDQYKRK